MKRFLLAMLMLAAGPAFARVTTLLPHMTSARVVVVAYHSGDQRGCTYTTNAMIAFQRDLETAYAYGWTVASAREVAEWAVGDRFFLHNKVIAFTLDDGDDQDYVGPNPLCSGVGSAYEILANFAKAHPGYRIHATSFVIASPTARAKIGGGIPYLHDDWWWQAENASGGLMSVENHSADHDHGAISVSVWDPDLRAYLRAASLEDGDWTRRADFAHVRTYLAADIEVRRAADFIGSKTGRRSELFSCPYSQMSDYLRHMYFPLYQAEHGVYAAFCGANAPVTRGADRYFLPRYGYGRGSSWETPEQFLSVVLREPGEVHPVLILP